MTTLRNLPACLLDLILTQRNSLRQDEIWQPTMSKDKKECVQLSLNKTSTRLACIEKVLLHKILNPPQPITFKTMETHGYEQDETLIQEGTHYVLHSDFIHEDHYICFTNDKENKAPVQYISFTTFEILGRKYIDRAFYVENEKDAWVTHGSVSNLTGYSFQFCIGHSFRTMESYYNMDKPLTMFM